MVWDLGSRLGKWLDLQAPELARALVDSSQVLAWVLVSVFDRNEVSGQEYVVWGMVLVDNHLISFCFSLMNHSFCCFSLPFCWYCIPFYHRNGCHRRHLHKDRIHGEVHGEVHPIRAFSQRIFPWILRLALGRVRHDHGTYISSVLLHPC